MRVSSKGQVTIPAKIREQAGIRPNTEVGFALGRMGEVRIFHVNGKKGAKKRRTRGDILVDAMCRAPKPRMTTEEIMKLTRGWK